MTSRELTFGLDFWSRDHLRMAVMHLPIRFGAYIFIQSGVIDIFPKLKMAAAAISTHKFSLEGPGRKWGLGRGLPLLWGGGYPIPSGEGSGDGRCFSPEISFFIFQMEMVNFGAFVCTVFTESQN